ncbi:MAG: hypothetical protein K9M98_02220 [Cephaloticoccus sp.]|nr:hypothetical protein [Cephaloticoccus sp.]MCF7759296.1 hypothetical protein [Cephaloticoccus sp.]
MLSTCWVHAGAADIFVMRKAVVEFVIDANGRAANPTITENASDLPEMAILRRLSWLKFPANYAGKKSRIPIEFPTELDVACANTASPEHMADGRIIYRDDQVDSAAVLAQRYFLKFSGLLKAWDDRQLNVAVLRFLVDEKGKVAGCTIIYTHPQRTVKIDERTVNRLEFTPARRNGEAVCTFVDLFWASSGKRRFRYSGTRG